MELILQTQIHHPSMNCKVFRVKSVFKTFPYVLYSIDFGKTLKTIMFQSKQQHINRSGPDEITSGRHSKAILLFIIIKEVQIGSTSQGSTRTVLKDITNTAHLPKRNSRKPSSTIKTSTNEIHQDEYIVGTDLFGGIDATDDVQVFDCSSDENTDTDDETDVDDPMDYEPDPVLHIISESKQKDKRPPVSIKNFGSSMTKFSNSNGND
ncbi:Uncharacterized protein Rs2_03134 [Raphanus sativus]|nr:Uncharacterized protein Rs2_03134 [Raphanus sativus]